MLWTQLIPTSVNWWLPLSDAAANLPACRESHAGAAGKDNLAPLAFAVHVLEKCDLAHCWVSTTMMARIDGFLGSIELRGFADESSFKEARNRCCWIRGYNSDGRCYRSSGAVAKEELGSQVCSPEEYMESQRILCI